MQVVECANDVRELLVNLRSPLLDSFGLVGALRYQAEKMAVEGQLAVTVSTDSELPDLPAAIEAAALAIVSEAMANVVRHSGATQCTVQLGVDPHLSVAVTDNGCGITPTTRDGIGLRSMRERAEGVGGTCAVRAGSCGGTVVRVVFPSTAAAS
jgi:signal transduction histidine kinase